MQGSIYQSDVQSANISMMTTAMRWTALGFGY
jgi:hypothetical protein